MLQQQRRITRASSVGGSSMVAPSCTSFFFILSIRSSCSNTHRHHVNGHFSDKSGIASCPFDSQSSVTHVARLPTKSCGATSICHSIAFQTKVGGDVQAALKTGGLTNSAGTMVHLPLTSGDEPSHVDTQG